MEIWDYLRIDDLNWGAARRYAGDDQGGRVWKAKTEFAATASAS